MRRVVGLFAIAVSACAPHFSAVRSPEPLLDPPPLAISRVELRWSNVHLLRGPNGVGIVDCGGPSDGERLTNALAKEGLAPKDVKVVVLTHGHGDHAGLGKMFQQAGAKIILGRGDESQTTAGKNDEMIPTSLFAWMLKPLVKLDYEPFTPDVFVDDELDLAPYGLAGARVKKMSGHTRGSVVVFVGKRDALVGDQILGGIWGGMFHAESAGEHYYQLEPAINHCNVQALLARGIETFHLGHGGPVTRDSVQQWQRSWRECDR